MLQDGPASPVKMAKKPVPVISESEEVDSFKFSVFSASGKIADYPKILA